MEKQLSLLWSCLMQFLDSLITATNEQWHGILKNSISKMSNDYLLQLKNYDDWLPAQEKLFSAFSLPLEKTKYILLGESPYPRQQSANGYAFWDNDIKDIWSDNGLSKSVNKATSLRNFIKMLLYIRGDLSNNFSKEAIANINKKSFIQTIPELFQRMLQHGFLLLNASLIYSPGKVLYHAKQWRPFIDELLTQIYLYNPEVEVILLGRISNIFANMQFHKTIQAEHPYNVSFITNEIVNNFFRPFSLLGVNNS
ncbi:MAG: uracil-DNA glycosylase [Legionellales bacterium RIFCSPHIGHO2_12_FULL_35_11]|nr:MAG: uracil-DNA glycosylase [Legionellales bacterium RIFCSPHIGHO2_12_FULL_35_11]